MSRGPPDEPNRRPFRDDLIAEQARLDTAVTQVKGDAGVRRFETTSSQAQRRQITRGNSLTDTFGLRQGTSRTDWNLRGSFGRGALERSWVGRVGVLRSAIEGVRTVLSPADIDKIECYLDDADESIEFLSTALTAEAETRMIFSAAAVDKENRFTDLTNLVERQRDFRLRLLDEVSRCQSEIRNLKADRDLFVGENFHLKERNRIMEGNQDLNIKDKTDVEKRINALRDELLDANAETESVRKEKIRAELEMKNFQVLLVDAKLKLALQNETSETYLKLLQYYCRHVESCDPEMIIPLSDKARIDALQFADEEYRLPAERKRTTQPRQSSAVGIWNKIPSLGMSNLQKKKAKPVVPFTFIRVSDDQHSDEPATDDERGGDGYLNNEKNKQNLKSSSDSSEIIRLSPATREPKEITANKNLSQKMPPKLPVHNNCEKLKSTTQIVPNNVPRLNIQCVPPQQDRHQESPGDSCQAEDDWKLSTVRMLQNQTKKVKEYLSSSGSAKTSQSGSGSKHQLSPQSVSTRSADEIRRVYELNKMEKDYREMLTSRGSTKKLYPLGFEGDSIT